MENKTRHNVIYQTHLGEEWVIASFMNWYDAIEYMESKERVLLGHYYDRLRVE